MEQAYTWILTKDHMSALVHTLESDSRPKSCAVEDILHVLQHHCYNGPVPQPTSGQPLPQCAPRRVVAVYGDIEWRGRKVQAVVEAHLRAVHPTMVVTSAGRMGTTILARQAAWRMGVPILVVGTDLKGKRPEVLSVRLLDHDPCLLLVFHRNPHGRNAYSVGHCMRLATERGIPIQIVDGKEEK